MMIPCFHYFLYLNFLYLSTKWYHKNNWINQFIFSLWWWELRTVHSAWCYNSLIHTSPKVFWWLSWPWSRNELLWVNYKAGWFCPLPPSQPAFLLIPESLPSHENFSLAMINHPSHLDLHSTCLCVFLCPNAQTNPFHLAYSYSFFRPI